MLLYVPNYELTFHQNWLQEHSRMSLYELPMRVFKYDPPGFLWYSVTNSNILCTTMLQHLLSHDESTEYMTNASNSVIMTFPLLSESPFGKFRLNFAPDGEHCVWSGNIDRTKYNPSREHKAYVTIIWVPMVWARFRLGPTTSRLGRRLNYSMGHKEMWLWSLLYGKWKRIKEVIYLKTHLLISGVHYNWNDSF